MVIYYMEMIIKLVKVNEKLKTKNVNDNVR